jgi:hypothetical protein
MPPYWQMFLEQHRLIGRQFFVPVQSDLSGVGAVIEILDEQGIRTEQTEAYPGIGVSKAGYVTVGDCSSGTGDPYFINAHDGEGGPLYRIYHEEVIDENYDPARAIVIVLKDYREMLKYADASGKA